MNRIIRAGAAGLLTLALAACATTTSEPAAEPMAEATMAEATMAPATPMPEATVVTTGAGPAVQIVPLQEPDQYYVGVEAGALVLAADSDGLGAVDLFVDGRLENTVDLGRPDTAYQGTLFWTPATAGNHEVVLEVRDSLATVTQATWVTVEVAEAPAGGAPVAPATPSGDTVPPAVSIELGNDEINAGEDVDVFVNAVDQGGVVTMELYANDELVETWTHDASQGAPLTSVFHTFTYRNVAEGQYDVYVKAYDSAGNAGQSATERLDVNP